MPVIIVVLLLSFPLYAQENPVFVDDHIMEINQHMKDASEYTDDTASIEANNHATELLREIFDEPDAYSYNYDSLEHITILESENGKLRIFTWNLLYDNLTHDFFGFIQYMNDDKEYDYYELKDKSIPDPEESGNYDEPEKWYGAIYYELIEKQHRNNTIYTLLGWKGQDALVQQKVIETLKFNWRDIPEFGGRRFRVVREKMDRFIFRYSIKTQMILRWNEKNDIIVCDHLSPGNPKRKGKYEYYGPDFSYDAFEFKKGKWFYKSNIDPDIAINYKKKKNIEQLKKRDPSKDF
ncbi:MAG: hypothetical protein R6V32_09020 [Bacteroidales bacterium]